MLVLASLTLRASWLMHRRERLCLGTNLIRCNQNFLILNTNLHALHFQLQFLGSHVHSFRAIQS